MRALYLGTIPLKTEKDYKEPEVFFKPKHKFICL